MRTDKQMHLWRKDWSSELSPSWRVRMRLFRYRSESKPLRIVRISKRSTTRKDICFMLHAHVLGSTCCRLLITGATPGSGFLDDLLMCSWPVATTWAITPARAAGYEAAPFDAGHLDCVDLDEVAGIVHSDRYQHAPVQAETAQAKFLQAVDGRQAYPAGRARSSKKSSPPYTATQEPVAPICVCRTSQAFGNRSEIYRPVWTRRPKGQRSCEQKCSPRILQGQGVMSSLNEATRKTKSGRIQKRKPRGACAPPPWLHAHHIRSVPNWSIGNDI